MKHGGSNVAFEKVAAGYKPTKASFGDILRREREAMGASWNDVSNNCGATKKQVAAWEHDEEIPNPLQLHKLCGMFRRLRFFAHTVSTSSTYQRAVKDLRPLATEQLPPPPELPDAPKTFGEALRQARVHEGMDQAEVGELMGVTGQAVSAWESGENVPVETHYQKLLDVFGDWLKDAPAPPSRPIPPPSGGRTITRNAGNTNGAGNGPRVAPPAPVMPALAPLPPLPPILPVTPGMTAAPPRACEARVQELEVELQLYKEAHDQVAARADLLAKQVANVEDARVSERAAAVRATSDLQRELDELHAQLQAPDVAQRVTVDPQAIVKWIVQVQTARAAGGVGAQMVALLDTASDLGMDLASVLAVLRGG
jgi:transcriptional regulator with XRE-family HTH domain